LRSPSWRVRLSETAERDFVTIVDWTMVTFGRRQAMVYRRTLIAALTALHYGPYLPDSRARGEIRAGLRSLHVARQGRRGRHFILYRAEEEGAVEIVRILHDAMDLASHAPAPDDT
jgi:toxin ParE1/3/4